MTESASDGREDLIGAKPRVEMPASLAENDLGRAEVMRLVMGGAAHELNNVFALLTMQQDVMSCALDLPEDLREMVDGLQSGIRRGIVVANILLQQASTPTGTRIPLNPKYLLTGLQKAGSSLFGEDKRVVTQYPERLPTVEVEPQVLVAALMRLCRHAFSFASTVTLTVEEESADDGRAALTMRAQGWDLPHLDALSKDPIFGVVVEALEAQEGSLTLEPGAGMVRLFLPTREV